MSKDIYFRSENRSFVSQQATEGYNQLDLRLAHESKNDKLDELSISCAISLETPFDLKQYFSWISVPSGNKLPPKIYSVMGIKEYLINTSNRGCPDPNRILSSLRHMETRVNKYLTLPDDIKNIKAIDVNAKFKTQSFKKLIEIWTEGKRDNHFEQLGIMFNIGLWYSEGYIHNLNHLEAEGILKNKEPKTFIVRKSSISKDGNIGDCTVFTISYVLDDSFVHNIRLVDVHGVGIYCVTMASDNRVKGFDINHVVSTSDMRIILNALNYEPPTYACFVDLLIDFADKKYIDLKKIVKVD